MTDIPPVLKPIPQRAFDIMPASNNSSNPPSPSTESMNPELASIGRTNFHSPGRTRSILNLTSSTLLGIYSNAGHDGSREEPSTPWGTGAQTPSYHKNIEERQSSEMMPSWDHTTQKPQALRRRAKLTTPQTIFRALLLFAFGMAYGAIITQLHRSPTMNALRLPGVKGSLKRQLIAWGVSGVLLGSTLPWVDRKWNEKSAQNRVPHNVSGSVRAIRSNSVSIHAMKNEVDHPSGWYAAVRSIGAFVGIAFAVRKLPWQSTLQASLTLALANPFLWYLIDRSKPGFVFSSAIGIAGTMVLVCTNPQLIPIPNALPQPAASSEALGSFIWTASVLFCTSLCFGAIGRKVRS